MLPVSGLSILDYPFGFLEHLFNIAQYISRKLSHDTLFVGGHRGRDRMVVGFITICANSAYHHYSCEFEPRS